MGDRFYWSKRHEHFFFLETGAIEDVIIIIIIIIIWHQATDNPKPSKYYVWHTNVTVLHEHGPVLFFRLS